MLAQDTSFRYVSFCVWDKGERYRTRLWKNRRTNSATAPRSWVNRCEYILHYVKGGGDGAWAATGLDRIYSNPECFKPLKDWYGAELVRLNLSKGDIAEAYISATGKKAHMLCHYFQDSQFELPTQKVWDSVYVPLGFGKSYEVLREEYEALRYTHNVDASHCNVFAANALSSSSPLRVHPTQKPLDLIRRLIRVSSNPGEVVLDPFMGSGTTAIAAMIENRHYIGYETNADYLAASVELRKHHAAELSQIQITAQKEDAEK